MHDARILLQKKVIDVLKLVCKNKNSPAVVVGSQNKGYNSHPKMQNKIGVHRVKGGKKTVLTTHSLTLLHGQGEEQLLFSPCEYLMQSIH